MRTRRTAASYLLASRRLQVEQLLLLARRSSVAQQKVGEREDEWGGEGSRWEGGGEGEQDEWGVGGSRCDWGGRRGQGDWGGGG
jgi:hypothetical protein